jgi:hypothetical protein
MKDPGRAPLASPARLSSVMSTRIRTSLLLVALLALALPAAAHASAAAVIRDCAQDGKIDGHYSQKDLRQAEQSLPSDIDEYTDCRAAIRAAMAGGSGSSGAPPGGIVTPSGAVAASPADVQALASLTDQATKGRRKAVAIGGKSVLAGNAGLGGVLGGLQGANGMPASLVAAIVALVLLAVVTAYLAAREKFVQLSRVALRRLGR